MVGGEHVRFRAMEMPGMATQVADEEPAQNRVKLFVFFSSHLCFSPS